MRPYILGFLGCITGLVACLFVYAQYSDYRERVELESLVFSAEGLQRELEASFKRTGKFDDGAIGGNRLKARHVAVEQGTIFVTGYLGQLLVLVSKVEGGTVRWQCHAGPERARPGNCRAE